MTGTSQSALLVRIRIWLALFMVGLVLSGLTAFPLERETRALDRLFNVSSQPPAGPEAPLKTWLRRVHQAIASTNRDYPFMAYGTDWLGFAHLVIAIAFVGPWIDPVRNRWVLTFGVIACAAVPVLAFVAGPIRGIPLYWRLIDSSFGIVGVVPLLICLHHTGELEKVARLTGSNHGPGVASLQ